jgi:ABC-type lipoprotein export system ATPase subunit
MLVTTELRFAYNKQHKFRFPPMRCAAAEQWLILGQSGCGKTTLLHLLAGLLQPTEGEISINEQPIQALSSNKLDAFRGKNIGIVLQQSYFVQSLNVIENLQLAQNLAGAKTDNSRINALLERLHIAHLRTARPYELSIGEQQRVAIVRALLNRPSLLLADEPTAALDDQNCIEVIGLLEEHAREEGATLVVVTHDQRLKSQFRNQIVLPTSFYG